eukprot:TRINITY_DN13009_c0_g1_i2.p1 TRINITY_DN13009_c0_g1~~TRINITY_DN13009_c0_g1_i2.p1  ORF type:complete len:403 (-),score=82.23 TRINITY_DN13009_c0_g1_i2:325-1533(-)
MSLHYLLLSSQKAFIGALKMHLEQRPSWREFDSEADGNVDPANLNFLWAPFSSIPWNRLALQPSLLVNHHLFRSALVRKDLLARMASALPDSEPLVPFMPRTVSGSISTQPHLLDDFRSTMQSEPGYWLLKPNNGSNGRGLHLVSSENETEWQQVAQAIATDPASQIWCLQKYIERPLLIGAMGHKFHIRGFLLIDGFDYYLYRDFVALCSAVPYALNPTNAVSITDSQAGPGNTLPPEEKSHADHEWQGFSPSQPPAMHITNFSLQSNLEATRYADHHRLCRAELEQELGVEMVQRMVQDMITIMTVLLRHVSGHPKLFLPFQQCFELFGLDWLVDHQGKVWLLEINANPGFNHHASKHHTLTHKIAQDLLALTVDVRFANEPQSLNENGFLPFGRYEAPT